MTIPLKEEFDRNGELLRVDFYPTADMLRYASARSSLANEKKSDRDLILELGIPVKAFNSWEPTYGNHFREWLYWFMENLRAPVRDALFGVGLDRAMRGEYNFWKDMARTVGAISTEKQDIKLIVSRGVDELSNLTAAELEAEQRKLLGELTGVSVAAAPQAEGPEGRLGGDSVMQAEPVAVPVSVGSDGGLSGPTESVQTVPPETPPSLAF